MATESSRLLPRSSTPGASRNCLFRYFLVGAGCCAVLAIVLNHVRHQDTSPPSVVESKPEFIWGAATSAYQIEGGAQAGGRKDSIWDTWCAESAENCNGTSGAIACDHYHRWKGDIGIMKQLGVRAYRFSISWSRILPNGTADYVNAEGIEFYSNILDALLDAGIEPFVTLYHWDLPQALQDEYGGWANRTIIEDFGSYARIIFDHFADRVKFWITINEAWTTSIHGYEEGSNAPGLMGEDVGGSGRPYLVGHHQLLAHARAVDIYRNEGYSRAYSRGEEDERGQIGIANSGDYRFALDPANEDDREAATRAMEFQLGWFSDPIWLGDYPRSMRRILGDQLPQFTREERMQVLGSSDFLGLNHYSSALASKPAKPLTYGGYWGIQQVELSDDPSWGNQTEMGWNVVPAGAGELLRWIDKRYNHPVIYVTENGMAAHEPDLKHSENDYARVEYMKGYIQSFLQARDEGVDLRGYFYWSLMDNFEWQYGYAKRFGIVHIDYETLVRTPKLSAYHYRSIIQSKGIWAGDPRAYVPVEISQDMED